MIHMPDYNIETEEIHVLHINNKEANTSPIEIHNEEVREIMQEIPGAVIRWGLSVIFIIFFVVIIGSYFFKFKDIVTVSMTITTTNPPAPMICKAGGRISNWFVRDGNNVENGDKIALIQNSTDINDLFIAEGYITELDSCSQIQDCLNKFHLPTKLELGEMQQTYEDLYNNWNNYRIYVENNFLPRKIKLLVKQVKKQKEQYKLALLQQNMLAYELHNTQKKMPVYKDLLELKGISQGEFGDQENKIIESKRQYINYVASIKSTEMSMISQNRSLLDLQEQYFNDVDKFEQNISNDIRTLIFQFKEWKDKYLLTSPIKGKVTLTKFWSVNHVVSAGDRIATIIPSNQTDIICRAIVPSSGIGKVQIGQSVLVKLSGYPYMEHGTLKGMVKSISLVPEKGADNEGYIVEIGLNEGMITNYKERLKLVQEMDGTADIITSEMRMIYRLINPLRMIFSKH